MLFTASLVQLGAARYTAAMSDELVIQEKQYISSKRAAEITGYAQDYIGQLARRGQIAAQRVGGLWYISMESLQSYKERADTYTPVPPQRGNPQEDPDSLISFDGKDHISAARAAKITGYHQDYVGHLARSGTILSRQVGNRWYVEREGILAHKNEKDRLLAAVQAQSVGIKTATDGLLQHTGRTNPEGSIPFFTYTQDERDLLPQPQKREKEVPVTSTEFIVEDGEAADYSVPIRVIRARKTQGYAYPINRQKIRSGSPKKTFFYGGMAAALTIVIVLSFGFTTLRNSSVYATRAPSIMTGVSRSALAASAGEALGAIGNVLEKLLTRDLVYRRAE